MSWSSLAAVARRRLWIVVLCTGLAAGAALAVSAAQTKRYTASASLLFRDPGFDQKLFGSTFIQPSADANREAATNVRLVSLREVAVRAAKEYGRNVDPGTILANVAVRAEGQSNLISVDMTDTNPQRAADLANEFAQQYIAFRRDADRDKVDEARRLIEDRLDAVPSNSSEARSLRTRADQLKVLAALQTGNAELVQPSAVPFYPSSPNTRRNAFLGGFLGLLLGLGIAFLLERLDRRLRDTNEIQKAFDRPILGAVPESSTFARSSGPTPSLDTPMPEAEAFRMMRANLRYFNVDRPVRSLYVTSAVPAEGKSTVSWNLASAAAGAGERVLLIEADLRRPTFTEIDGMDASVPGLGLVLAGNADIRDSIQPVTVHPALSGARADATMDVIVAGPPPPNPADLIESPRMRELLKHAEATYDLVVVDTPPTSVVSDAIPLVQQVSGVIVVSRLGKSTRDSTSQLREQLHNLRAHTLGVVVNGVPAETFGYGYGSYGYNQPVERNGASRNGGNVSPGIPESAGVNRD